MKRFVLVKKTSVLLCAVLLVAWFVWYAGFYSAASSNTFSYVGSKTGKVFRTTTLGKQEEELPSPQVENQEPSKQDSQEQAK